MFTKKEIMQLVSDVEKHAVWNFDGTKIIDVVFKPQSKVRWGKRLRDLAKSHIQALRYLDEQREIIESYQSILAIIKDTNIPIEEKAAQLRNFLQAG